MEGRFSLNNFAPASNAAGGLEASGKENCSGGEAGYAVCGTGIGSGFRPGKSNPIGCRFDNNLKKPSEQFACLIEE